MTYCFYGTPFFSFLFFLHGIWPGRSSQSEALVELIPGVVVSTQRLRSLYEGSKGSVLRVGGYGKDRWPSLSWTNRDFTIPMGGRAVQRPLRQYLESILNQIDRSTPIDDELDINADASVVYCRVHLSTANPKKEPPKTETRLSHLEKFTPSYTMLWTGTASEKSLVNLELCSVSILCFDII